MAESTRSKIEVDACVIGAGPAGTMFARRMSLLGYRVCIIERSESPPRRVCESLPQSILPVLDLFDVRTRVEDSDVLRFSGQAILWRDNPLTFKEQPGPPGFLIDRPKFHAILRNAAREANVEIFQPSVLRHANRTPGGWSLRIDQRGGCAEIFAQFLVDASGRSGPVFTQRRRYSPLTVASYAYWRNSAKSMPVPSVEAGSGVWYWGAPTVDGSFIAIVFTPLDQWSNRGSVGAESRYRSFLGDSKLLNHCLNGTMISRVSVCDASCSFACEPVSECHIKIGDANLIISPLSSQGTQAALVSAFQAAAVVNTIMSRPRDSSLAVQFYRTNQSAALELHKHFAAEYFDGFVAPTKHSPLIEHIEESSNSVSRQSTQYLLYGTRLHLSDDVSFVELPGIDHDLIVNRPSIIHKSLKRPVAFVNGVSIVPLLKSFRRDQTCEQTLNDWSRTCPLRECRQVLNWLYQHGIVVQE